MRLHALTCGWLDGPLGGFLAGADGRLRVPVPCFLIEHRRGLVLFDSGLHRDTQRDPGARLGILAQVFGVEFASGEEVGARLAGLGVDAARVTHLVTSHLHFDHSGGHAQIPNARLVVQRREWQAGAEPDLIASQHYNPADYALGHDVLEIDGEHDLFGDGRIVCLPTPGHTPGHQSLRVRLDSGDVILTADACYLRRTLEDLHLPSIVHDEAAMRVSLLRLRALREGGARLVFGHEPAGWEDVAASLA